MTSAEIDVEMACPLKTACFPHETHEYDPNRHCLIERLSKYMITREEARTKFSEYRNAQGLHDEVYTDGIKFSSSGHQPPFPECEALSNKDTRVRFCWVISHCGIEGKR